MSDIINACKDKMDKTIKSLENDLGKVRTGRASIKLLDGLSVDYYGSQTPLNQVANLSTPDARTIVISPYEKTLIQDIEKCIMQANLGVQPTNDGAVVRIPIVALTEEKRKDIVKQIKKMGEDSKIALRHIRRDANDSIKKQEKGKELAEDEAKKLQQDVQKEIDGFVKVVDETLVKKEKEVMTI